MGNIQYYGPFSGTNIIQALSWRSSGKPQPGKVRQKIESGSSKYKAQCYPVCICT